MKEDQAFEEVARQYEPLIKGMIQKLHLYKDFEDMYQVGMIALWEAYEKFDSDKGSFGGYAKSTVKGRLLSALRQSKRYDDRNVFAKSTEDDLSMIPDPVVTVPMEGEMISGYLENLSDRQRFWVEQVILQGRKTREIAASERVSPHTVRCWKKEALRKMREYVLDQ